MPLFLSFYTVVLAETNDVAGVAPTYAASVPSPTLAEVRYGPHQRNVLDFWRADSRTPTPLVFVIHGGGWTSRSKEFVDRFVDVRRLLEVGISVVAINYRYTSTAKQDGVMPPVKAPMEDCVRALQFVRSRAEDWNIDKQRIGAAGGSAGACSALWLAFHDDQADPRSADPVARESTRFYCVAVRFPQTSLDPQQVKAWIPNSRYGGHAFGLDSFAQFVSNRDRILPWVKQYSPYEHVSADDPPVYLAYSAPPALGREEPDPTHSATFGVKLQERCTTKGVPCELVYPGAPNVKHLQPTDYLIAKLKAK
jgi:acetyl esterase/lipase